MMENTNLIPRKYSISSLMSKYAIKNQTEYLSKLLQVHYHTARKYLTMTIADEGKVPDGHLRTIAGHFNVSSDSLRNRVEVLSTKV